MAEPLTCSRALRVLGQNLEAMGVDMFEIRGLDNSFYLQYGDPKPPHLAIVSYSISWTELISLDLKARSNRRGSSKFVDFHGFAEILRALGRYVESKNGRLLRICNCDSFPGQDCIILEFESSDGRKYMEELLPTDLSDSAMDMYKNRSRMGQEHIDK